MEAKVMNPVVISDLILVSCNSLTNSHVTHKCEAMTYYGWDDVADLAAIGILRVKDSESFLSGWTQQGCSQ